MTADLDARRAEGASVFASLPTPTEKLEHWKYVDLGFDPEALTAPASPEAPMGPDAVVEALVDASARITVVDGAVVDLSVAAEGIDVVRFADVDDGLAPSLAVALAAGMSPDRDRLSAASLAHATDGVLVRIHRGVELAAPVVVDVQAVATDVVTYPHVAVRVDDLARGAVVVVYRSPDGFRAVVPRLDISVGDGAGIDITTVQTWGGETRATAYERLVLGRDTSARIGEVGLGAALGRLDLRVDLEGDGSSVDLDGLSFGDGDQTLDYRVVMRHAGRNTSSNVFLKGAVEDRASSVFTGLLRIEEDATRTSAFETNRNLVLSDDARAQSVPNLEILCDDVVCGHGSSVGQLEEEPLYYLMSRGLPRDHAERVMVHGFFEEILDELPSTQVRGPVRDAVNAKYEAAQAEGRV
ncbi:MAG: Fe-S cluster assembly protein SufD [Acidimicrobiia bacterium]